MEKFSKKPEFIQKLFNSISKDYNKLNDIMSFGAHRLIKKNILKNANLLPAAKILDLCTGTGDIAGFLQKKYPDADITGVDFSEKMLQIARQRYPSIEFLTADCMQLPFEDERFALCIISFGLRNIEDMNQALKEIYRVLKKGGTFINLDLGKPNWFLNIFARPLFYLWVSLLGRAFHGNSTPYEYLAASNEDFPSQFELAKIYKEIGFEDIKNTDYLFGQIASQKAIK